MCPSMYIQVSARMPYNSAKEPCNSAKMPYDSAKTPYNLAKVPCDSAKESYERALIFQLET